MNKLFFFRLNPNPKPLTSALCSGSWELRYFFAPRFILVPANTVWLLTHSANLICYTQIALPNHYWAMLWGKQIYNIILHTWAVKASYTTPLWKDISSARYS